LECMEVLSVLLVSLGFVINDQKREGPAETLTFLGVSIDCVRRTLSLPESKLHDMKILLDSWSGKEKCTKRELQKLLGSLNWCSRVIRGGRTFSRMLINLLTHASKPHHHIRLTRAAKNNVAWWITALSLFHGDSPFFVDIPLPAYVFGTDACEKGGGSHFYSDWLYVDWSCDVPHQSDAHINVLELEIVYQSALRWGRYWHGQHVLVRTDNTATLAAINNGTSKSVEMMHIVERLFWLSIQFDFRLSASFVPGKSNVLADRISRLSSPFEAGDAYCLLHTINNVPMYCCNHMSYQAFLSLQEGWRVGSRSY
jgi:hypothetical protein